MHDRVWRSRQTYLAASGELEIAVRNGQNPSSEHNTPYMETELAPEIIVFDFHRVRDYGHRQCHREALHSARDTTARGLHARSIAKRAQPKSCRLQPAAAPWKEPANLIDATRVH